MNDIAETIRSLQPQIKTFTVDSQRHSQIGALISSRRKYYDVFFEDFNRMSSAERQFTRFGDLPCLWSQFPPRPTWGAHIGNAEDPGDGLVFSQEHVDQVTMILKALYQAWSETAVQKSPLISSTMPKVEKITEMPKICLVLYGMKQNRLLDHFQEHGLNDKDLPLDPSTIKQVLPSEDSGHAFVFSTEQYRIVPREWKDRGHIVIPQEEPLPLEFKNEYGSGSYGTVTRCLCKFTQNYYARKESLSSNTREHLKREIDRLKLLDHRHIVQFGESYERGDAFGLLLQPAATTDLKKLLKKRYGPNPYNYEGEGASRVRERSRLYPIMLTSFGCLSRGLAQINSRNIRHKDIKPANILYESEYSTNKLVFPARFLWADFGLAHYFGPDESSKTSSNMANYNETYAAPESIQKELLDAYIKRADRDCNHLQVESPKVQGSHEGSSDMSKASSSALPRRGRSADIFSFGCVFLETLSYLVIEGQQALVPLDREEFELCKPFHNHIDQLKAWAFKEIKQLKPESPLKILFEIGIEMIAREPRDRPKIHTIVQKLRDAGSAYFCRDCQPGAEEDLKLREEHLPHGYYHRQTDQLEGDSLMNSQIDYANKELLLAGLAEHVASSEPSVAPNEAPSGEAESSTVAARRPSPKPAKSAMKHATSPSPERGARTPHFQDLNWHEEGLP